MTWTWKDDPDDTTPLSAANLNTHIEDRLQALELGGSGGGALSVLKGTFAGPVTDFEWLTFDDIVPAATDLAVGIRVGPIVVTASEGDLTGAQRNVQLGSFYAGDFSSAVSHSTYYDENAVFPFQLNAVPHTEWPLDSADFGDGTPLQMRAHVFNYVDPDQVETSDSSTISVEVALVVVSFA